MNYLLSLAAQNGNDKITTILSNIDTNESRTEEWELEDGSWIWQTGWGDDIGGLYEVLNQNDTRTDALLNEVVSNFYGEVEFEA